MSVWIGGPRDIAIKLADINAKKLAKEILANKNSSKESKQLAKEIEKLYYEVF